MATANSGNFALSLGINNNPGASTENYVVNNSVVRIEGIVNLNPNDTVALYAKEQTGGVINLLAFDYSLTAV